MSAVRLFRMTAKGTNLLPIIDTRFFVTVHLSLVEKEKEWSRRFYLESFGCYFVRVYIQGSENHVVSQPVFLTWHFSVELNVLLVRCTAIMEPNQPRSCCLTRGSLCLMLEGDIVQGSYKVMEVWGLTLDSLTISVVLFLTLTEANG